MSKVKVEDIVVNDKYTYPAASKKKLPRERLYKETTSVRTREIVIDEKLSSGDKVKMISSDLESLDKRYQDLRRELLFIKLMSNACSDYPQLLKDLSVFENYLKKFSNDLMLVSKYFQAFRIKYDENNNTLSEIIEEVYRLFDFSSGLVEDIKGIKKKYFNEFKVSTIALIKDKSLSEIEDLMIRVDSELAKYKTLEEASDYITYNSGKLIIDVVNGIVKAKKTVKKDISYYFFLQTSDIISFELPEWIELFVRINYVRSKDSIVFSNTLLNLYRELETKYAIMIIASEKHEKRINR